MPVVHHLGFPKFANFHTCQTLFLDLASSFVQNLSKVGQSAAKLSPQAMFSLCLPSWIYKFEFWSNKFHQFHCLIQCAKNFLMIGSFSAADNNVHISGRPPSWICDDVIILCPVIDFYVLNIVLNCHIDWFVSSCTSFIHDCVIVGRQRDRHCRRLQPTWDIIVRIGHYLCRMNWNVRQWLVNMCCLFRDTKHLKNDLIFPVMWLNEVWLTVVVTVDSWQYSVSGKIRPPKHVKITLWIENKNYYFFCIMKSHLFAMFVWNLMITSLSIVEILLFIWRWSKIVVTSIAN